MIKYITVIGANLSNKGAEAMLLTTICEMKKYFPDEILLVVLPSEDRRRAIKFDNVKYYFARNDHRVECYNQFIKNHSKCIIDISGFALSSKFGYWTCCNYLYRVNQFKKQNIPVYLLPQSFGPFNFEKMYQRIFVKLLLLYCMKFPKMICAREVKSYQEMLHYTKKNLYCFKDIVLTGMSYTHMKELESIKVDEEIREGSVAVIPNEKIFSSVPLNAEVSNGYRLIIKKLLSHNFTIYLIAHSDEDRKICRAIKNDFSEEPCVQLIDKEFRSWQFENIISKFSFVVASRYHAIVHAYRENIPCLVLGWADKYKELVEVVHQEKYYWDCSEKIDTFAILEKTDLLCSEFSKEKEIIKNYRNGISNQFQYQRISW